MSGGGLTLAGLSKSRVEGLTDGIFSTVMTVLVLSLSIPVIASSTSSSAVQQQLIQDIDRLLPLILSYVLSFIVLGLYWSRHHNMFHFIVRMDQVLLWLNILFLLTIGFIPFSTALMGTYPEFQIPVVVYGSNLIAIGVTLQSIWFYSRRYKLIHENTEGEIGRIYSRTIFGGPFVAAVGIVISFYNPEISVVAYVVAPITSILLGATRARKISRRS